MNLTPSNWSSAEQHLLSLEAAYTALLDLPRANPLFALLIISELKFLFYSGVRSESLFSRIMNLK